MNEKKCPFSNINKCYKFVKGGLSKKKQLVGISDRFAKKVFAKFPAKFRSIISIGLYRIRSVIATHHQKMVYRTI